MKLAKITLNNPREFVRLTHITGNAFKNATELESGACPRCETGCGNLEDTQLQRTDTNFKLLSLFCLTLFWWSDEVLDIDPEALSKLPPVNELRNTSWKRKPP
jgi:hypothetical protein